jgi:transcriptional regulator with XRE-family HTH domain
MDPKTFKELFEEAERHPEYHKERAILEYTEELSRVMQQQGVTRTELGRRIGSSQAYVSRVLNGGANFTLATMTKLAMALGMELRMHLAPSGAQTVWRDTRPLQTKRDGRVRGPAQKAVGTADATGEDSLIEGYLDRAEECLEMAEITLPAAAETLPR